MQIFLARWPVSVLHLPYHPGSVSTVPHPPASRSPLNKAEGPWKQSSPSTQWGWHWPAGWLQPRKTRKNRAGRQPSAGKFGSGWSGFLSWRALRLVTVILCRCSGGKISHARRNGQSFWPFQRSIYPTVFGFKKHYDIHTKSTSHEPSCITMLVWINRSVFPAAVSI